MNEQKRKYRIRNWRSYNAALVAQGWSPSPSFADGQPHSHTNILEAGSNTTDCKVEATERL